MQQSQTRHCYLGGKGPRNFHWSENSPALVFPDTLRGQAYDTEEPFACISSAFKSFKYTPSSRVAGSFDVERHEPLEELLLTLVNLLDPTELYP